MRRMVGVLLGACPLVVACGGGGVDCPAGTERMGERCVVADSDGAAPDAGPSEGCVERRWYLDADGDGHGDPGSERRACESPGPQYVEQGDDCDDACAECFPGNAEACDGLDNDCSGEADDASELCVDDGNPCTVDRCIEGACGAPEHGWHPCGTDRVCGDPESSTPGVCLPMPPLRVVWRWRGGLADVHEDGRLLIWHDVSSTERRLSVWRLDPGSGDLVEEGRASIDPSGEQSDWGRIAALDAAGGDAFVVGSRYVTVSGHPDAGWAAIYERQADGAWRPTRLRHIRSLDTDRQMGRAVALHGGWAAVAQKEPDGRGSVVLFQRQDDGAWRAKQRLGSDAPAPGASFGRWLRFADAHTLLVSDDRSDMSGALHVFTLEDDGTWARAQVLTAPLPQPGAGFGLLWGGGMTSTSFDRLVVPERGRDVGTRTDRGALYLMERGAGGNWQVSELVPSGLDPDSKVYYGSVRGDWAVLVSGGLPWGTPVAPVRMHLYRRRAAGVWEEVLVRPVGDGSWAEGGGLPPLLAPNGLVVAGAVWPSGPDSFDTAFELIEVTEAAGGLSVSVGGSFLATSGMLPIGPLGWKQGWLIMLGMRPDFSEFGLLVARAGD